jgi:photosystem I subunit 3
MTRRLFALILVLGIWLNFAPQALAVGAGLVPCSESPEFLQRAANARATTDTTGAQDRFKRYADSGALCGPEGLPHLIVDGRLDHAGDFLIPSILFLYIAGWIGWMGRSYIRAVKKAGSAEMKEIIIDVPLAFKAMREGALWPVLATQEFLSGDLTVKDEEIPVSVR